MSQKSLSARDDSDSKGEGFHTTVSVVKGVHAAHYDSRRETIEGDVFRVVEANTPHTEIQSERDTIDATMFRFVNAEGEGRLSINLREAAFEANRHTWLSDATNDSLTRTEQAGIVGFYFDSSFHEGDLSSETVTTEPIVVDAMSESYVEGESATDAQSSICRAEPTQPTAFVEITTTKESVLNSASPSTMQTELESTSSRLHTVDLWFPSIITKDGALYIRQTWGGSVHDTDTIHIS